MYGVLPLLWDLFFFDDSVEDLSEFFLDDVSSCFHHLYHHLVFTW